MAIPIQIPSRYLGLRLRRERNLRRLPLRQVAGVLCLDQAHLSKYERGLRLPPPSQVEKLAAFYGMDPSEFMALAIVDKLKRHTDDPTTLRLAAELVLEEQATYSVNKSVNRPTNRM